MSITGPALIFFFGCVGGAFLELLRWWKLRESEEYPVYVRKIGYWLITIAMILVGGFVAVAYGTNETEAVQAMNLGASAPAILGALATAPVGGGGNPSERSKGMIGSPRDHLNKPLRKPLIGDRLRTFIAFGK